MTLAEAIRALRGTESQQAFATRLGIAIATQQNWEGYRERRYAAARKKSSRGDMEVLIKFFREACNKGKWDVYDVILEDLQARTFHQVPRWQLEYFGMVPRTEVEIQIAKHALDYLRTPEGRTPNNPVVQLLLQSLPDIEMHPRHKAEILEYFKQ